MLENEFNKNNIYIKKNISRIKKIYIYEKWEKRNSPKFVLRSGAKKGKAQF